MNVTSTSPGPVRLDELPSQTDAIVRGLDPECEDIDRLQTLGVCTGRKIRIIKIGDPLIIKIYGSRIGLSASLAAHVWLEKCDPARCAEPNVSCQCREEEMAESAAGRHGTRQSLIPNFFHLSPLRLLKSVLSFVL